ncbi:MAG: bifunctional hydroxymethylpyrimidine kinase/phosphomethylpyrimidine kinase [Pseudomonadota bacterium]
MKQKNYHYVLTIAGSDSCAGAGIQADLKTLTALGCYGLNVITALTAQNSLGVQSIYAIDADFVQAQLTSIQADFPITTVKIGMLHTAEIINVITSTLVKMQVKNIIVDPVMVAKGGAKLLTPEAVAALELLLTHASLITPNIEEAKYLLQIDTITAKDMVEVAMQLSQKFRTNVLLKGGHLIEKDCIDVLYLYQLQQLQRFKAKRIITPNNHGTGCTYASAIAAFLARGNNLESSIERAKDYLTGALIAGRHYKFGQGHGPVLHFYKHWE